MNSEEFKAKVDDLTAEKIAAGKKENSKMSVFGFGVSLTGATVCAVSSLLSVPVLPFIGFAAAAAGGIKLHRNLCKQQVLTFAEKNVLYKSREEAAETLNTYREKLEKRDQILEPLAKVGKRLVYTFALVTLAALLLTPAAPVAGTLANGWMGIMALAMPAMLAEANTRYKLKALTRDFQALRMEALQETSQYFVGQSTNPSAIADVRAIAAQFNVDSQIKQAQALKDKPKAPLPPSQKNDR